jgi:hypothetical protein
VQHSASGCAAQRGRPTMPRPDAIGQAQASSDKPDAVLVPGWS